GSDVWAAGANGTILRLVGGVWSPVASGTTSTIVTLTGRSSTDLWATGFTASYAGTVLHWDGGSWTPEAGVPTVPIYTAFTSAANELWIGGPKTSELTGVSWSTPADALNTLHGMWGVAPGDVWAVGRGGDIEHWNGSAWADFAQRAY